MEFSSKVVTIQEEDFSIEQLQADLLQGAGAGAGASVAFTGYVRSANTGDEVLAMELEHYPGMTEKSIAGIIDEACGRWSLLAAQVVHRVGRLLPGERIVYVGVAAAHRREAFAACEFIMDYLKTRAPFWKKETTCEGERWVEARSSDTVAAQRW
jgi:molybdopterin synthase catalytic subunit